MLKQILSDIKRFFVGAFEVIIIFTLPLLIICCFGKCAEDYKNSRSVYTYVIIDKNTAIDSKFLVFGASTEYILTLKNTTTGEVFTHEVGEREFYTWKVGYTLRGYGYYEEDKLRDKN